MLPTTYYEHLLPTNWTRALFPPFVSQIIPPPRQPSFHFPPLPFDETKRWENAVKSQEAADAADGVVLWVPLFKPIIFGWVGRGRPAGSTWIVGRRRRAEEAT